MRACVLAVLILLGLGSQSCRRAELAPQQALGSASGAPAASSVPSASAVLGEASLPASSPPSSKPPAANLPGCDKLPPLTDEKPIGPKDIDVWQLAQDAQSGNRKLIRLLAQHPDSAGGDPDFSVRDTDASAWLDSYLVFPPGVLEASRFRFSPSQGSTLYAVVGRFSGREIDHYEWNRLQYGSDEDPKHVPGELQGTMRDKWPEFCVQSWCFVPDPVPDSDWPPNEKAEIRKAYRELAGQMKAAGAKLCTGVVHHKQKLVGQRLPKNGD